MLDTQTYTHTHSFAFHNSHIYRSSDSHFPLANNFGKKIQLRLKFKYHIFYVIFLPYITCRVSQLPNTFRVRCVWMCVFAFFNRFEIYFHLITWETSWSQIFLCNSVKKMRANICMPVYNVHVRVCVSFGSTEFFFSQIHTLSIFDT